MSDFIMQTRLSLRLDMYRREYTASSIRRDALSRTNWDKVWHVANTARTHNVLTPEMVDAVWQALKILEFAKDTSQQSLFP